MSLRQLPPPRLDYIWQWFCKLSGWREIGMALGAISHVEIATWAKLMRFRISPAEVECIRSIDIEFRAYIHEKNAPPRQPTITEKLAEIADQRDAQRLLEERRRQQAAKAAQKKEPTKPNG